MSFASNRFVKELMSARFFNVCRFCDISQRDHAMTVRPAQILFAQMAHIKQIII